MNTTKTQEHHITKILRDCNSWLGAYETFMMSFNTLKTSPTFIRIAPPLGGSPLYFRSPLTAFPIEDIYRKDSDQVKAEKKARNYKMREMRDEATKEELDRVYPYIVEAAKPLRLRVIKDKTSLILKS